MKECFHFLNLENSILVQLKVPGRLLIKLIGAVAPWQQTVWLLTGETIGKGLTVIENVWGAPTHPLLKVGVTVIRDTIVIFELFCVKKEVIFPLPDGLRPMFEFEFVQAKLELAVPLNSILLLDSFAQNE